MSMAALLHRHLFGVKGDVRDPVCYVDEQTVLYPAGHNTCIFNLEQRIQRFLPGTDKTEEITAITVSANKKFVAVAEKSDKGVITIFDLHSLKRRRLLTATDSLAKVSPRSIQPSRPPSPHPIEGDFKFRGRGTAV